MYKKRNLRDISKSGETTRISRNHRRSPVVNIGNIGAQILETDSTAGALHIDHLVLTFSTPPQSSEDRTWSDHRA